MHLSFIIVIGIYFSASAKAYAETAIVVSKDNKVVWDKDHPDNQIKDIFLGKKDKFPDGSSAKPIDQPEGHPIRQDFYLKLIGKDDSEMNAYWSNLIFTGNGRPPRTVSSDEDVKKSLKENVNGIGYIDSKSVDNNIKVILTLK